MPPRAPLPCDARTDDALLVPGATQKDQAYEMLSGKTQKRNGPIRYLLRHISKL